MAPLTNPSRHAASRLLGIRGRRIAAVALIFGATGCTVPMQASPGLTRSDSVFAEVQFRAVLEDHWEYVRRAWPEHLSWAGERAPHLPVLSLEAVRQRASFARSAVRALEAIRYEALPEDHYISWLTMYWEMTVLQRAPATFTEDLSFASPASSPLRTALEILRRQPITDSADAKLFLRLAGEYAALADSIRAGLAWRASRGVTLSRMVLPRTVRFIRSLMDSGAASPVAVAAERSGPADSVPLARFRAELADSIARRVNPALERLAAYLDGEYRALATERIGIGQFPGGLPRYRSLVRYYSTLEITPDEAHAIGLREVAQLDSLVDAIRVRLRLPPGRDALLAWLRADSMNAVRSSVNVLDRILAEYGRAAAVMGPAIGRAPESTADVQALELELEDLSPLATYTPPSVRDPFGHYRFNTRRWRDRTMLTLPATVHQDLLPGRHVQAALERENAELPAFRRVGHHPGYVEGWSAYAIELADSLLTAADSSRSDGAKLGTLLHRQEIACGLVVDTGINYYGWTREQALEFLRRHLLFSDEELEIGIIMPSVELPGSLVAAGIGAREFRGLRRWAQQELGARFTLRAFHDEVLGLGSVPLPVLGTHLEWWLWRERNKPVTDTMFAPARSRQRR